MTGEKEGEEEYCSAVEYRRTTEKKKKKRGPSNQIESNSARPKREGARTPDRARNNNRAKSSAPGQNTRSKTESEKQSFGEKGNKKI